jgi:hypothetical protein
VFIVRPTEPDDEPFLWDMGWAATAMDAEMRALGRDAALAMPHVRRYLNDWGRPGDTGVVAVSEDGQRLGAAWYRLFPVEDPGWGFVAADVPALSIGVVGAARGRGVGDTVCQLFRAASSSTQRRITGGSAVPVPVNRYPWRNGH